jgi:hypothetical protein
LVVSSIPISGEKIQTTDFNNNSVVVEFFTNFENSDAVSVSEQLYRYYSDVYTYSEYEQADFYYVTMINELSEKSLVRADQLGISSYPTVVFDGGFVKLDDDSLNRGAYENAVSASSSRSRRNVEIYLTTIWSSSPCYPEIIMDVEVLNFDEVEYNGRLLIYFARINPEIENPAGRPYDFVFEDFAADIELSLEPGIHGEYEEQLLYHPVVPGCYSFNAPNYLVVASVFSDDTGFADYTIASRLSPGEQPYQPTQPQGQTKVEAGVDYLYKTSSSDVDGDPIKYVWDWNGDYMGDEWTDYYNPGEEIEITHTWENRGNYNVMVKAIDEDGFSSFWSEPLTVSFSKSKVKNRFFNVFDLLLNFRLKFLLGGIKL